jgi:hypothetical protein
MSIEDSYEDIQFARFKKANALLKDGIMPECLGKDCSKSCCGQKLYPSDEIPIPYVTSLFDECEYVWQTEILNPSLQELEIDTAVVPVSRTNPGKPFTVIRNCQKPDGSCKLQGRKPLICMTYPFGIDPPKIFTRCPKLSEILKNKDVMKRIMQVRGMFVSDPPPEIWMMHIKEQAEAFRKMK